MSHSNYEKLQEIREADNIDLAGSKFLVDKFETLSGEEIEFNLRHYQKQMVLHLLLMNKFIVGDDTGLGKSLEAIAAVCYLWEKEPDLTPIIVTKTSAMRQWGGEVDKFTTENISWTLSEGGPDDREAIYEEFFSRDPEEDKRFLILNYPRLRRDKRKILSEAEENNARLVSILDEASAFKNTSTKTHSVCEHLVEESERAYGLTATLIKNNLVEGYGIFNVIYPDLFKTKTGFYRNYCVTRKQRIPGGRKIPIVVGHSKDHIRKFKERIDPYYLGRAKHDVADELPLLTTKEIEVTMASDQWKYYRQALDGLIEVNQDLEDEETEEKETTQLTQLMYCQQIANSPHLIGNSGDSAKEDVFLDMLEGELEDEKVIVFSRFRGMVDRLEELLNNEGYENGIEKDPLGEWQPRKDIEDGFARITGAEDSEQRDAYRKAFTEDGPTDIIFITMAGAEAINLQQARIMIFFDLPWSAGDYLQLIGRMIRIGSPHQSVYAMHLLSEGPLGDQTIDHHVTKTLDKKMGFIEGALGERVKEGSSDDIEIEIESETQDIFDSLVKDAVDLDEG